MKKIERSSNQAFTKEKLTSEIEQGLNLETNCPQRIHSSWIPRVDPVYAFMDRLDAAVQRCMYIHRLKVSLARVYLLSRTGSFSFGAKAEELISRPNATVDRSRASSGPSHSRYRPPSNPTLHLPRADS